MRKGRITMQLFKMNPVFKDYIWGGTRLKDEYEKNTPFERTAESWEIAAHKNGESTVCGGEYDGKTINELADIFGKQLLGDRIAEQGGRFPLLIKFIDANDNLSVQVHPDDDYAYRNENGEKGKTEMWYVMDAKEGAKLIYGFKQDITKQQLESAIADNTLLDYVNFVECQKGDSFFIPSGMLHAIGKGLMIAEIQQNSDTTYRVYDYDRRDANGNARELHVEKAKDVLNLKKSVHTPKHDIENGVLESCEFFTTEKITLKGEHDYTVDNRRFETLIVCDGNAEINGISCKKGDSLLVPAYVGNVKMSGNAVVLRSYI